MAQTFREMIERLGYKPTAKELFRLGSKDQPQVNTFVCLWMDRHPDELPPEKPKTSWEKQAFNQIRHAQTCEAADMYGDEYEAFGF